jgi:hypothetical protein
MRIISLQGINPNHINISKTKKKYQNSDKNQPCHEKPPIDIGKRSNI